MSAPARLCDGFFSQRDRLCARLREANVCQCDSKSVQACASRGLTNLAVKLIGVLASAFDNGQFSFAPFAYS
jgi:hypothetical protein